MPRVSERMRDVGGRQHLPQQRERLFGPLVELEHHPVAADFGVILGVGRGGVGGPQMGDDLARSRR